MFLFASDLDELERIYCSKEAESQSHTHLLCVYQSEPKLSPESSHWQGILNSWNKVKTNFILAWFFFPNHASLFFDFSWSISGPLCLLWFYQVFMDQHPCWSWNKIPINQSDFPVTLGP